MKQISIRFDDSVMNKIREMAKEEDRSIAYIVNRILKDHLLKGE